MTSRTPPSTGRDAPSLSLRLGLALAVATVFADASVVVLALPGVLQTFGVSIERVSWVITGFNLALAVAALPAALLTARLGGMWVTAAGLAGFAGASGVCALAGSFDVLLAARCIQAVFGAAVVCGTLALLPALTRSHGRAIGLWATAAALGAAVGPAAGGALTQAFSWRAVFAAQVPLALVPLGLLVVHSAELATEHDQGETRPRPWPNLALSLVSAALTAALFLLVLMLVRGWGLSPLAAAGVVSVIPAAAIATRVIVHPSAGAFGPIAAGLVLVGGGLAALALVPSARVVWTIPPQLLIGAGLALTLPPLTHAALEGAGSVTAQGGWTVAARHAGVVIGLLILTPLFTSDLATQETSAQNSGTTIVLNSPLSFTAKLSLGNAIEAQLGKSHNETPDLRPAFEAQHPSAADRPMYDRLLAQLNDQVLRAATHAFYRAFLVAALIALLGLVPLIAAWRSARGVKIDLRWPGGAFAASLLLVCVYVALGGARFTPGSMSSIRDGRNGTSVAAVAPDWPSPRLR